MSTIQNFQQFQRNDYHNLKFAIQFNLDKLINATYAKQISFKLKDNLKESNMLRNF